MNKLHRLSRLRLRTPSSCLLILVATVSVVATLLVVLLFGGSFQQVVEEGPTWVVKLRLNLGVDPDAVAPNGSWTPLQVAVQHGRHEVARILLEAGADPLLVPKDGCRWPPLHLAARADRPELVHLLIQHGVRVDAREDVSDWTALHTAAAMGSVGAAEALIEEGADVNAKGYPSETSLDLALEHGNKDMAQLLREHGAKRAEELRAE